MYGMCERCEVGEDQKRGENCGGGMAVTLGKVESERIIRYVHIYRRGKGDQARKCGRVL